MNEQVSLKRWHPLLGEWVIIAPVTSGRPVNGSMPQRRRIVAELDPNCYLCPGVKRASGEVNPQYAGVFVFNNDFPAFSMNNTAGIEKRRQENLPAHGVCRVVCFDPRHNVSLAEMDNEAIAKILSALQREYRSLSNLPGIENVLIFENKGEIIGVSNLHPHGQIYATDFVPRVLLSEHTNARQHMESKGTCLFCDVLGEEVSDGTRIICQNSDFVAYVPYFARYAYEVHILPRRHVPVMTALESGEVLSLARIYHEVLVRYDNLFEIPFPNITLFHNVPCGAQYASRPFHFHIEFCPPLRSANQMKYMAGFETGGGNVINPAVPEESAKTLRSLSSVHYTRRSF